MGTHFWHPVADMHAVAQGGELLLERGEGSHVWDTDGRRYVDATAGLWYANVGYGRTEIAEAAAAQMGRLHAYSHYGDVSSPPTTRLAERVAAVAPFEDAVVFFASGGGESIETAAKMCRRYWSLVGQPDKTVIVTRERCYHGLAGYGTSIVGSDVFRTGVGPLVADTTRVAWDSVEALADAIDEIGPERVAAFFCEPIIGAGGVLLPPDGYLTGVQRVCRERDVLFLVDEVICGFGRVGDWFASNRLGLSPDLLTFAKGITSGYVPLGGVVVAPRVRDAFWAEGAGVWRHGYTYSGHATAAAAAHANLDIMEREGVFGRARELERELTEVLGPLGGHELVSGVRSGLGAVAAVQIDAELLADDPGLSDRICLAAREHGVLSRVLVGGGLQISPPLVITPAGAGRGGRRPRVGPRVGRGAGLRAASRARRLLLAAAVRCLRERAPLARAPRAAALLLRRLHEREGRRKRSRNVRLALYQLSGYRAAPAPVRRASRTSPRKWSTGKAGPGSQWSLFSNARLTSTCPVTPRASRRSAAARNQRTGTVCRVQMSAVSAAARSSTA